MSDDDYRLLVLKTNEKVRTGILVRNKLDLLITPSFCTGDVSTVAFRGDIGVEYYG